MPFRPTLAWQADVDQLDHESLVAQMRAKVVTDPDVVDADGSEVPTIRCEEPDHLASGVLTAPGAHLDDFVLPGLGRTEIDYGLGFAVADVDTGNQAGASSSTGFANERSSARSSQSNLIRAFWAWSENGPRTRDIQLGELRSSPCHHYLVLIVDPPLRDEIGDWLLIERTAFARIHFQQLLE
jgi:hypothetical protein